MKNEIFTNMQMTYGDLRRLLLSEFKQVDAEIFELDATDILSGCLDKTGKTLGKKTQNGIWFPYQYAQSFKTSKLQTLYEKVSDALGESWKFTPKEALAILKLSSIDVAVGDNKLLTFVPSSTCREYVFNQMARDIAGHFKNSDIDFVI